MKDDEDGLFSITVRRCKRCGSILISRQAIEDGYGHVCKMKALTEENEKKPLEGQMSFLDNGGYTCESS